MYNTGMENRKKRVYVDSTVVSGMFDYHLPERVLHTTHFWDAMQRGEFVIIASDVQEDELRKAPIHVRDFFAALPESQIDRIISTSESDALAAQYIDAKVISENHMNDCKHVALATIAHADAVVSWNCGDMVNPHRIPKYNEANEKHDYQEIKILTPNEFMEAYHGKN